MRAKQQAKLVLTVHFENEFHLFYFSVKMGDVLDV